MTPQFITLPSGTAVNTAHIISARREDNGLAIFTTEGPFMAPEDLTMEAFLALLSPPSSPIVSPVLELRLPKKGEAVMFQWKGKQRHGVVSFLEPWNANVRVGIISHGQDFYYLPEDGSIEIPELSK